MLAIGGVDIIRKWVSDPRFFRALTIGFAAAVNLWFFGGKLVEASTFFTLGAIYGVLLFRVVSRSVRATFVMTWAFHFIFLLMLSVEGVLDVPAAGPLYMGFAAGSVAGGHRWTGNRAGSLLRRKRERAVGGGYTGGWQLALINAGCVFVLLMFPAVALIGGGLTPRAITVSLAAGFLGGWGLYRFVKSLQIRFMALLGLFVALLPAIIFAGASGYGLAPLIAVFGLLAGILVGGRYWWGPRCGAPRPPFAGEGKRRRKKKKKRRPAKPVAGAGITGKTTERA